MFHRAELLFCNCLILGLVLASLASGHAQSRTAASQMHSTTVNDQINLQVLSAITQSIYASYTNSCTDGAGTHVFGSTWSTDCPIPYTPGSGQMTYTCISGYPALQNNTCH